MNELHAIVIDDCEGVQTEEKIIPVLHISREIRSFKGDSYLCRMCVSFVI